MAYYVHSMDNRGDKTTPFGFIYLSETNNKYKPNEPCGRVGYGAHRNDLDPLAVWPTLDTPNNISRGDTHRIRQHLRETFSHLADKAAT